MKKEALQLFEQRKVRTVWDDDEEKWYFSIVDVCGVLTDSKDALTARKYWNKLKQRLKEEGNETVTNCHQLKLLAADGKKRLTDVADTEQLFRIIQSIPSPKAEPFKQWMAQVASQRLDQMQDPELSIDQAIIDYKRLGYSDAWINQRIKSIEVRKELTDEWKRTGVEDRLEYASLTDIITREWSGFTTKQYKHFKGLKKENLRDNMTNLEIALNILAEASATELSKQSDPKGYVEQTKVAKDGGSVAKAARNQLESKLGRSVISSKKASDYLLFGRAECVDNENNIDVDVSQNDSQNDSQNVSQNVSQNDRQKLGKRQQKILQLISENIYISAEDIAKKLNVTPRTIYRDLKSLQIRWSGPSKTGHWELKRTSHTMCLACHFIDLLQVLPN